MSAFWRYLRGFFEEGRPQSSSRLCAVLMCLTACIVAIIGACRQWDSSMIVLALGGSSTGALWQRKAGAPTPTEKEEG